jgi:glucosamine--fructose-6-phosphate aminotransferase (isomerizing)
MTLMKADILRQPAALGACLQRLRGAESVRAASRIVSQASEVLVAGIGASYHAALAVAALLGRRGRFAQAVDLSELPARRAFRSGTAVLALSRSGRSAELSELPDLAGQHGLRLAAVTNDPESPLARAAEVAVVPGVAYDHAVSVVTYTAVALAGGLVADPRVPELGAALEGLERAMPAWSERLESWTPPTGPAYFLARGAARAAAREARLLWEEAVKSPAASLSTGEFRHGPQELVRPGMLVGLWIDRERRREEDLAMARELRELGAEVLLVGQDVPDDGLSFRLPGVDPGWQFLLDAVPLQLAAERASRARGVDCDTFRLCSYVVETSEGLRAPATKGA